MKPKLLIIELWGVGDLVIGTPFIRAAAEMFEVTLLAKPYALDLQQRFWPGVTVHPFVAPWTAFKHKYRLWNWRWSEFYHLHKRFKGKLDVGVSARWDPRDHFLLALTGARRRLGFPRMGSQLFLTETVQSPSATAHRYEYWRALGSKLGLELPEIHLAFPPTCNKGSEVLIHSGASQAVRVWPLPRYHALAKSLREKGFQVRIACDANQRDWWMTSGETAVSTPRSLAELLSCIDQAAAFIGNDSGPGHLAALMGVPTFTFFGPQIPELFVPMHSAAEFISGSPCRYMPCSDYCRFPSALCLEGISEAHAVLRVEQFLRKNIQTPLQA